MSMHRQFFVESDLGPYNKTSLHGRGILFEVLSTPGWLHSNKCMDIALNADAAEIHYEETEVHYVRKILLSYW